MEDFIGVVILSLFMFGLGTCIGGECGSVNGGGTMKDRCAVVCTGRQGISSYSNRTHVCVCANGDVAHVRSIAEPVAPLRPRAVR